MNMNVERSTSLVKPSAAASVFATLVDLARHHARVQPDKQYLLWLDKGREEGKAYTFAELDYAARALAVELQRQLALRADTERQPPAAIIATQPGPQFVLAFFACLYAGIAAVPVYPQKKNESSERLCRVISDAGAQLLITDRLSLAALLAHEAITGLVQVVDVDQADPALAGQWQAPAIDAGSVAFIQYTSGSTGIPKGVVVTHANLMSNEQMIAESLNHDHNTVYVSWLPVFHDLGLIGLLQAFYLGVRCILMSPLAFVANPLRWLEAISRYRATTSGAPNFAYDLCLQRTTPEQRQQLDLSSWTVAYSGAEPVRKGTLERFAEAFADSGFRAQAYCPCYGMAESTLFVTGVPQGITPLTLTLDKAQLNLDRAVLVDAQHAGPQSIHFVSSGVPAQSCQVRVVDPQRCVALADDLVGEIWVSSPSVSGGYRNRPQLSQEVLQATLEGEPQRRFLRTGDLGFMHQGELFVTGRRKDLIIIDGKNHYPHDLEQTIESTLVELSISIANAFSIAAFSVDRDEREQLVVVISLHKSQAQIFSVEQTSRAISAAVARAHGVALDELLFVSSRLPLTSSGKLQRAQCRSLYLDGQLQAVASPFELNHQGTREVTS